LLWISIFVIVDLIIVTLVLVKCICLKPEAEKKKDDDLIDEVKAHIDASRKTEMYEAIFFTSVINLLFILGIAFFLLDMTEKFRTAQESGTPMPYVLRLIAFNWVYLAITICAIIIAGFAYSTEISGTHEFEKRTIAYTAFGVDMVVKLVTSVCGAIVYMQFEHESMLPFLILAIFCMTIIHINIYDMIKVKQLHRPETDDILKDARNRFD